MKVCKAVDGRFSPWRSNDGGTHEVWIIEQFQIKNNKKDNVKLLVLELSVLRLHLVHKPSMAISPVFTRRMPLPVLLQMGGAKELVWPMKCILI